jgi:hypothetical protein
MYILIINLSKKAGIWFNIVKNSPLTEVAAIEMNTLEAQTLGWYIGTLLHISMHHMFLRGSSQLYLWKQSHVSQLSD